MKTRAIRMLESGVNQFEITGGLSVAQSVISRSCIRFYQTGSTSKGPRSGEPWKTTAIEGRYLRLGASVLFATGWSIRKATEARITPATVLRRFVNTSFR